MYAGAGERLSHLGAESTGFQLCEYIGIFLPFVCHAENQPDSVRLIFVYLYLHGFRVNTVAKRRHSSSMLAVIGILFQPFHGLSGEVAGIVFIHALNDGLENNAFR